MSNSGNTGSLTGTGNTAVGKDAGINITSGSNNITIGGGDAVGTGSSNTIVGVSAQVSGASTSNATAIGFQSKSAVQGTAIGNSAFALASKATALGNSAIVGSNASNSTAIGNGATVDASNATALGNAAIVGLNASNSTAIGNGATVDASNSTAIGIGAIAELDASNSTAIGYGAKVSDPNTIQLGAAGNTEDIDGVTIPAVTNVKTSGTLTAGAVTYPKLHGDANQVLSTTGSGTLTWVTPASAGFTVEVSDEFTATASQASFTLSNTPGANSKVKMYINGIRISNSAYSISGTTLTYDPTKNDAYTISAGDRIQFDFSY
jgi:hypothetical protein